MKKFTLTTLIALSLSITGFSQTVKEPVKNPAGGTSVNRASNSNIILLSPADGMLFKSSEGSKPVLFRWTAIVPKPKEAVTYRLKVWQLMQGQNGTEAMRSNQPIITKDVDNITQAAISNLYTGPCKPPYICNFVWGVEVLNSDGVTIGNTYAASSSFKFDIENQGPVKAEAGNKGNAGNTRMPTGKSLAREKGTGMSSGKSLDKELDKSQPTKSLDKELDKSQPTKSLAREKGTGMSSGKSLDKELDKSQPTKSLDKELDKSQPTKSLEREKGSGQASGKSINREVDGKGRPAAKSLDKEVPRPHPFNLPVEKITYDAAGNILEIVLSIKEGAPVPKVVVAGSNIIAGDNEPQVNKKCKTVYCHNPNHPPGCGWQECM